MAVVIATPATEVATVAIELAPHQIEVLDKLKSGSILCGGVGSGKSRTALAYYYLHECGGKLKINGKGDYEPMSSPKDLYIITTAKKRDSLEWLEECGPFCLSSERESSIDGTKVHIDSWNNIKKYANVRGKVFIFDEQRIVGAGTWTKTFLKIAKSNNWILLTATPGDTWSDYVPVFVANNFFKNRTEFFRQHAVYNRFTKYPKVERYTDTAKLIQYRDSITVIMNYVRKTETIDTIVPVTFDEDKFKRVWVDRWNIFADKPVKAVGELFYLLRKVVNSHPSRLEAVCEIFKKHPKLIVFYNFDYELEALRTLNHLAPMSEWNGHQHDAIPNSDSWLYLVQYAAGAEGWNCIETDATIFYSMNYSYKAVVQAAGRIDRVNTPFSILHYFHLRSKSMIDIAIGRSLRMKKDFNMLAFLEESSSRPKHML